jgi:hypothetical protein
MSKLNNEFETIKKIYAYLITNIIKCKILVY